MNRVQHSALLQRNLSFCTAFGCSAPPVLCCHRYWCPGSTPHDEPSMWKQQHPLQGELLMDYNFIA
jgi:hypothetical protein